MDAIVRELQNRMDRGSRIEMVDTGEKNEAGEPIKEEVINFTSKVGRWAYTVLNKLQERSPTSLGVSLRLLCYGHEWTIDEAFQREYYLANKFMNHEKHPDFVEGVEKQLSKEKPKKSPRWQPATISRVSQEMIDTYFTIDQDLKRMEFVRTAQEPYKQKPYPQGLPSENDIQDALFVRKNLTPHQYMQTMVRLFDNKLGLEDKLGDVYERLCDTDEEGYVVWVGLRKKLGPR